MKRLLFPLLAALALPAAVKANPAIYGPQICTMLKSNIPIDKAWKYVTDSQVQRIIDRERAYGGFQTEFGVAISAQIEANKVLGSMKNDVLALALSQCPEDFWQGYSNIKVGTIKNSGSVGLTTVSINGQRYIASVFTGGDAFLKGVKPGSKILEINNINIKDFTDQEYLKLMPKNIDEEVTLLIELEGKKDIYKLIAVPSENISWPKGTKIKIKKNKSKIKSNSGLPRVNCNSPVWKKKPICN